MDEFCVMFERADREDAPGDEWVPRLEDFIRNLITQTEADTRRAVIEECVELAERARMVMTLDMEREFIRIGGIREARGQFSAHNLALDGMIAALQAKLKS